MEFPILIPMPPTRDQIARDRIRSWIRSTGITQVELAERIGRNQAWLSRYLNAEIETIDLDTLERMARTFNHSLTALLDLPADPEEAALIADYRALGATDRTLVRDLLKSLGRARARPGGRARR